MLYWLLNSWVEQVAYCFLIKSHVQKCYSGLRASLNKYLIFFYIFNCQVERAVRHKKIFSLGGNFPSAKRALIKRGWIEVTSRYITVFSLKSSTVKHKSSIIKSVLYKRFIPWNLHNFFYFYCQVKVLFAQKWLQSKSWIIWKGLVLNRNEMSRKVIISIWTFNTS